LIAENQPFDSTSHEKFRCNCHGRLMAGRVKSPMAASEHFSSQNLDLADWPVWRKLIDRLGLGALSGDWPLSGIGTSLTALRRRNPKGGRSRRAPYLTDDVFMGCGGLLITHLPFRLTTHPAGPVRPKQTQQFRFARVQSHPCFPIDRHGEVGMSVSWSRLPSGPN